MAQAFDCTTLSRAGACNDTEVRTAGGGISILNFPYIANNITGPSGGDLPVLLIDFDSRDAVLSISLSPEAMPAYRNQP